MIPTCTSDAFVGRSDRFAGADVVDAVLQQLFEYAPPHSGPTMAHADRVIISGGAGVLARIDELGDTLLALKRRYSQNETAALDVLALCDGCLLLDVRPPLVPPRCSTDADCPAPEALPRLQALLGAGGLARPRWCGVPEAELWRCFAAPLRSGALARSSTPVLVQQLLFDGVQLASWGVRNASSPTEVEAAWAIATFSPAAAALLSQHNYSFGASCVAPQSLAPRSAYFNLDVRYESPYNITLNRSLSVALPSFLEDAAADGFGPGRFGRFFDTCAGYACGAFCAEGAPPATQR